MLDLPKEIIHLVLQNLSITNIKNYVQTCKTVGKKLRGFRICGRMTINFEPHNSSLYDCITSMTVNFIPKYYPSQLTHLTFDDEFNHPIISPIPIGVGSLFFGSRFNQPLKPNIIPYSVQNLIFGTYFNQSIKKAIPFGVVSITFGYFFNRSIRDAIPPSVKYLYFGQSFNKPIKENIPSVTNLTLGHKFNQQIIGAINNVKYLYVDNYSILDEVNSFDIHEISPQYDDKILYIPYDLIPYEDIKTINKSKIKKLFPNMIYLKIVDIRLRFDRKS